MTATTDILISLSIQIGKRVHGALWARLLMLVLPLWVLLPAAMQGQEMSDTLDIRFARDSVRINMDYDGNGQRWAAFEASFRKNFSNLPPKSLRIDIYSGASPEGSAAYNQWLGENRGQAMRRLVRMRLGRIIGEIIIHNEGARWDGLYELVAASNEPWRDKVLSIIEKDPSPNPNQRDHRETRLRALHGGTVWPVLQERYLAKLRGGASAVLSWQKGSGGGRDTIVVMKTIVVRDTVVVMNTVQTATTGFLTSAVAKYRSDSLAKARRDSIHRSRLGYPAWAVKTNLLMWGVVAPNIQLEIPLGRQNRWSLELEYFSPWFIWGHNSHASQCQNWGAEVRYWLGNRKQRRWLEGWHVGIAVAAGYYDFEWKKHEGYQGEHINTYVNIGYQRRWGEHWGMDFGVGVGALFTKYRHYFGGSVYPDNHLEEWDEHLIYHDKGNFTWAGPCHANITLAYFFNAWPLKTKSQKLEDR